MASIYIFKYPTQPGLKDRIFNPSTGSAREEDMAIAMSRFSLCYITLIKIQFTRPKQGKEFPVITMQNNANYNANFESESLFSLGLKFRCLITSSFLLQ